MAVQRNTAPQNGQRFEALSTSTTAPPEADAAAKDGDGAAAVERV
jgi:hypothetical protein